MFTLAIYLQGLVVVSAAALAAWAFSLLRRKVDIVDSVWSLMFVLAALTYAHAGSRVGPRSVLVLVMVTVWALRLSAYITWRNWGHGEDRRYQAVRARNEPNFSIKSLYLVFGLQALLAWVISLPLLGALSNPGPMGVLDWVGAVLWMVGFVFEAGGDWQLARFKSASANRGKVMDRGLWGLTRHPNYFGDFCIWWGLYLTAVAAGAWWSIAGPAVMSVLLMRVSGVSLLEKDIGERRPQYADYVRRINAFFPGRPKPP